MTRLTIKRFLAILGLALHALYWGARFMLEALGYTTAPEDYAALQEKLPKAIDWLFSTPWYVPSLTMFAFTGLVIWICWPQTSKISVKGLPFDPDLFTYDPQYEVDKRAYSDLMDFTLQYVLPACENHIELQREIIRNLSKSEIVTELAIDGLHLDSRPTSRDFWKYYGNIAHGIDSSEPTIKFEALIDCIKGLERNSSKHFWESADKIAGSTNWDYKTDSIVSPVWEKWRKSHNNLVSKYDNIKRDIRFEKLFRPRKPSRWGEIIPPINSSD